MKRQCIIMVALVVCGVLAGTVGSAARTPAQGDAPAALATAIVIREAVADAAIRQGQAGANLGDEPEMRIGWDDYMFPPGQITRVLVRFDLLSIPAGNVVLSATLRLYHVNSWDWEDTYDTLTAYGVQSAWDEMEVTWSNAPAVGAPCSESSVEVPDLTGCELPDPDDPTTRTGCDWRELNVTSLVGAWVSGSAPNYGIYVRGEEASGIDSSFRVFTAQESTDELPVGFAPQLAIAYGPQPTATQTRTPTPTFTPTLTQTPSPTATATPTASASWTPSPSPTATITGEARAPLWLPLLLR